VNKILLLMLSLTLTGCGTYGEPLLLARMYDSADPCQRATKPTFCGAASGQTVIYATPNSAPLGAPVGYIKK
jgi:predicted small lipoprotein YifL